MSHAEPGCLILETGKIFKGQFLGGVESAGEIVFNTSHSGYEEIATDPSYFNQILVMTPPMQGNYGDNDIVWESSRIHIKALICMEMQDSPINNSWKNKLISYGVPILSEVDTRSLVLYLREEGTLWGSVVRGTDLNLMSQNAVNHIVATRKIESDWPFIVATKQLKSLKGKKPKGPRVAIIDFGCKNNIINELLKRCSEICIFPPRTPSAEILKWKPNAVLLSNGPGNPENVKQSVEIIKKLIGKIFIFGICMGHQILALALGAKTQKLLYGHRGSNHPVKDTLLNKIYVTSQNHGFVVTPESLPSDATITHVNLNDGTIEGFYSKKNKCLGIQFHPESHPGPHEGVSLFDFFIKEIKKCPSKKI